MPSLSEGLILNIYINYFLWQVAREEPPPPPPEMTPPPEEMPPPPPQDKKMPSLVSRHKRSPKGGGTMPTRKG